MSVVSGIMIMADLGEDSEIVVGPPFLFERLNDWIERAGHGRPLRLIDNLAGGNKHPQFYAAAAGINRFAWHEDAFAAFALSLAWEFPENLVIVIQPENGPTRVYRPLDYQGD